jgi:prevent-host-death family protein
MHTRCGSLKPTSGGVDWCGPNGAYRYSGSMTRRMTATEAKAKILALLDEAAAGEEIEITKHGRTVARLVPAGGSRSLKGSFAGVATTAAEEEEGLFTTGASWDLS